MPKKIEKRLAKPFFPEYNDNELERDRDLCRFYVDDSDMSLL